jgi:hypothetical protein
MATLDLFQEAKVEIEKPEPMTEVKLGHRSARCFDTLNRKKDDPLDEYVIVENSIGQTSFHRIY